MTSNSSWTKEEDKKFENAKGPILPLSHIKMNFR